MSNHYGLNLLTPATIAAARYAQQEQPALLQAAMNRCDGFAQSHRNADEVAGLARTIVASILPPRFRMGYGESYAAAAPEGREVYTISTTAARTATDRAAAAVAKDYRDAATLDALTADDPDALDRLAENDARLTLARYAPDPQSSHATTASDRLAAALAAVQPEHVAALVAAMDAWTDDARSLAAAVAMAHRWTNASAERRRFARSLAPALADLAPLAAAILTNPHGRSTEQTDARTAARPTARRAAAAPAWTVPGTDGISAAAATEQATADAARQVAAYTRHLASLPNDPARQGRPTDHGMTAPRMGHAPTGEAIAAAVALAAPIPATATARQVAAVATGHAGRIDATRRAAQRRAAAATGERRPERWTPEQDDRGPRAWTPRPRTAATTIRDLLAAQRLTRTAAAAVSRPGALAAGRFDPAATDPTTASHVIVRTATATEVRDATDGHLIATRPADEYAALMAATRQPAALAPRDRERLVPGLPDQQIAEARAALATPGPVRKSSSRKRATTGSTGPTVPAWR